MKVDRRFVEKRLTDEQAELAGEHWEKAMKLARRHAAKYPEHDLDWESAAAFGLCDAAFRFEAERKTQFWTFASTRVKFAFIDMMRLNRTKGYSRGNFEARPDIFSLDGPVACVRHEVDYGKPLGEHHVPKSLHDIIPSEAGTADRQVSAVYDLTSRLGKTAREIVRLYYCHGFTQREIGDRIGMSESRVGQLHKAALEFLRGVIHPETYDRRAAS